MADREEELLFEHAHPFQRGSHGVDAARQLGHLIVIVGCRIGESGVQFSGRDALGSQRRLPNRSGQSPSEPHRHRRSSKQRHHAGQQEEAHGSPERGIGRAGDHDDGLSDEREVGRRCGEDGVADVATDHAVAGQRLLVDERDTDAGRQRVADELTLAVRRQHGDLVDVERFAERSQGAEPAPRLGLGELTTVCADE